VFVLLFYLFACDPGNRQGNMVQILDQLRRPVASIEALSMTHQLMCLVPYRRNAMAIKIASKLGACACDCHKICIP